MTVMKQRHSTSLLCHSCQSTGAKLEPTVLVFEQRCMKRKERGGGVTDDKSHSSNEIDLDDDSDGSGDSDNDNDDICDKDEVVVKRVWGWFTQRRDEENRRYQRTSSSRDETDAENLCVGFARDAGGGDRGGGMGGARERESEESGKAGCSEAEDLAKLEDVAAAEEGRLRRSRDVGSSSGKRASEREVRREEEAAWLIHSRSAGRGARGGAERRRWCTSRSSEEKEEVQ
ncbi:hypothetical protein Syun_002234 [Stephania yunnanensis]|uniref:Uncharacterized protein n=1 Tax=Stephania yunnanensis TaxID=152371 RepID=A0AAP0Q8L1_9MAGN